MKMTAGLETRLNRETDGNRQNSHNYVEINMENKKIKPHTECKDDKEFWSQYYGRPVTDYEVEEIRRNMINRIGNEKNSRR